MPFITWKPTIICCFVFAAKEADCSDAVCTRRWCDPCLASHENRINIWTLFQLFHNHISHFGYLSWSIYIKTDAIPNFHFCAFIWMYKLKYEIKSFMFYTVRSWVNLCFLTIAIKLSFMCEESSFFLDRKTCLVLSPFVHI